MAEQAALSFDRKVRVFICPVQWGPPGQEKHHWFKKVPMNSADREQEIPLNPDEANVVAQAAGGQYLWDERVFAIYKMMPDWYREYYDNGDLIPYLPIWNQCRYCNIYRNRVQSRSTQPVPAAGTVRSATLRGGAMSSNFLASFRPAKDVFNLQRQPNLYEVVPHA